MVLGSFQAEVLLVSELYEVPDSSVMKGSSRISGPSVCSETLVASRFFRGMWRIHSMGTISDLGLFHILQYHLLIFTTRFPFRLLIDPVTVLLHLSVDHLT